MQPMGACMQPVGACMQPVGARMQPVGARMQPVGARMQSVDAHPPMATRIEGIQQRPTSSRVFRLSDAQMLAYLALRDQARLSGIKRE